MSNQAIAYSESSTGGSKAPSYIFRIYVEFLAISFWCYVIANTFFINIDALITSTLPAQYGYVWAFKFLVFLGVSALSLFLLPRKRAAFLLAFVLFYPAVLLFWRLPALLIRIGSWPLAMGFINALITCVHGFRSKLLLLFIFSLCLVVCVFSNSEYALAISATMLLSVLVLFYIRATKAAFSTNALLKTYIWIVGASRSKATKYMKLDAQLKTVPVTQMDQAQLTKWSENLAFAVLLNRACLFAARKLHLLHTQGYLVASSALLVIFLLLVTTVTFAAVNYALYKVSPASFDASTDLSFFTFVYYSFNTFVFNFIREIVPVKSASHGLWMVEAICGIVIGIIFAAQLLSYRFQKHTSQLAATAEAIEREGKLLEDHVAKEWQLPSIDAAILELERAKSSLLSILVWLSQNSK